MPQYPALKDFGQAATATATPGEYPPLSEFAPLEEFSGQEMPAGLDYTKPLEEQHRDVGFMERQALKNLHHDAAARTLREQGFEVSPRGPNAFSIRKPGDAKWRVVDPDTGFFSTDFISDVADLGGDLYSGAGATAGALVGGALGAATGPGALAAGAAGSAVGAAAAEGGKQSLLAMAGYDVRPGEALGEMGEEAAYGAIGEVAGAALRPVARAGKRALFGDSPEMIVKRLAKHAEGAGGEAGSAARSEIRRWADTMGSTRLNQEAGLTPDVLYEEGLRLQGIPSELPPMSAEAARGFTGIVPESWRAAGRRVKGAIAGKGVGGALGEAAERYEGGARLGQAIEEGRFSTFEEIAGTGDLEDISVERVGGMGPDELRELAYKLSGRRDLSPRRTAKSVEADVQKLRRGSRGIDDPELAKLRRKAETKQKAASKLKSKADVERAELEMQLETSEQELAEVVLRMADAQEQMRAARAPQDRPLYRRQSERHQRLMDYYRKILPEANRIRDLAGKMRGAVGEAKRVGAMAGQQVAEATERDVIPSMQEALRVVAQQLDVTQHGMTNGQLVEALAEKMGGREFVARELAKKMGHAKMFARGAEGEFSKSGDDVLARLYMMQPEQYRREIGRNFDDWLREVRPTEPFNVAFSRRTAERVGTDVGDYRNLAAQRSLPFEKEAIAAIRQETRGLSLGEINARLASEGWQGELGRDSEDAIWKLYSRRVEKVKGGEWAQGLSPAKYDLTTPMVDREGMGESYVERGEGYEFRRMLGKPDVLEAAKGGEPVDLARPRSAVGQFGASQGGRRIDAAAKSLIRGAGNLLERTGAILEAPARLLRRGTEKGMELASQGRVGASALRGNRGEVKEGIQSVSKALGRMVDQGAIADTGVSRELRKAASRSYRDAGRLTPRTTELERVRDGLFRALERAKRDIGGGGFMPSGGEDQLSMLSGLQGQLRGLPGLPETRPFLHGVSAANVLSALPEASLLGELGFPGLSGVAAFAPALTKPAAGAAISQYVGKGFRSLGQALLDDVSGETIGGFLLRASQGIAEGPAGKAAAAAVAALEPVLKAVRSGDRRAASAAVFIALHSAGFRQWARAEGIVEED